MFRVIIAGSRNFDNYNLLKEKVFFYIQNKLKQGEKIIFISGRAMGADRLGEKFALENHFELKLLPANWENNGKNAGYIRNMEMIKIADAAIVFWDGNSPGTKHLILNCQKKNIPVKIVYF